MNYSSGSLNVWESWESCHYSRLIRSEDSMEFLKLETVSKNRVGAGSYRAPCPWPMSLYNSHGKTFTKAITSPQIHPCEVPMFSHFVFRYHSMVSISGGGQEGLREKLTSTVSWDTGAILSACRQKPNAETQAIQSDGLDKESQKENSWARTLQAF